MRISLLVVLLLGMLALAPARDAVATDQFPRSYMIENLAVGQSVLSAQRVTDSVSCAIQASLLAVDTLRKTVVVKVTVREDGETSRSHQLKLREELVVHCPRADMMSQIVLMSVHPDGLASFEQHTYIHVNRVELDSVSGS